MMKNLKLTYLLLLLMMSNIIVLGQDLTDRISKDESVDSLKTELAANNPEDLNEAEAALPGGLEELIQQKEEKIPHKSFWVNSKESIRQFLLEQSQDRLPAQIGSLVVYVIGIVFEIPALIILILLSLTFILNVLIVAIVLVVTTFYKSGREAYRKSLNDKYEQVLTEYLFEEGESKDTILALGKIKSRIGRNLLIEILFNYQRNLSGEYRDRILDLYKRLNLNRISEKRISSVFSHRRVLGIRELSNMYPSGAKEVILRYVRDKNAKVRSEAQIAYVYLDNQASFDFLDDLEHPFSKWVQLNILNYVKLHEKDVPSFEKWLNSVNNDVQDFAIRMINYFQQNENAEFLLKMLDHPNEQTRFYAYQGVRSLNLIEAKHHVVENFENESYKNRVEILRIIGELGDQSDFDLLANILRGDDVRLKLQACKTLSSMGDLGKSFLKEHSESEDLNLNKFIDHVKDSRN